MTHSYRLRGPDFARGIAVCAMIAYHFCYALDYFGFARFLFATSSFWLTARFLIVSLFLSCVGFSLVLAYGGGVDGRKLFRRVAVIGGCALLVSSASYLLFDERWIYFGVLHCIAVSSLIGVLLLPLGRWNFLFGVAVVLLGFGYESSFFDVRATSWIGFGTFKPNTEDYVPLFPWLGMVLIGIALATELARREYRVPIRLPEGTIVAAVSFLGRHALIVYMAHMPLIMGVLFLVRLIAGSGEVP